MPTTAYDPHKEAVDLLLEEVKDMDMQTIIKSVPDIYHYLPNIDSVEVKQVKAAFLTRAAEIGDKKLVQSIMTACEKDIRKQNKIETIRSNRESQIVYLDYDKSGAPEVSIQNFLNIMRYDPFYKSVRYNQITNQAELIRTDIHGQEILTAWSDAEESTSRNFIESEYKL